MDLMDLGAKYKAFGWEVIELEDGNDMGALVAALEQAKTMTGKGKPILINMHTEMGYGVKFMMGSHKWHGVAPNDDQLQEALNHLPLGDLLDYMSK
jgi:transketolase